MLAKLPYVAWFSGSGATDGSYTDVIRGTSTAITTRYAELYANSINDPQAGTAGEHKPYTTNEWAARYQKYRVLGVKFECQMWPTGNSGTLDPAIAFMYTDGSTIGQIPIAATDEMFERPRVKIMGSLSGFNGGRTLRYSRYIPISKVFGKRKSVIANDDAYEATTGTGNPTQLARIYFGVTSPFNMSRSNGAAITGDLVAPLTWVRLTYYVKFTQPIAFGEST